jgi:hypothetical protein
MGQIRFASVPTSDVGGEVDSRTRREIARLQSSQHGLIASSQFHEFNLSRSASRWHTERGMVRLLRGVYLTPAEPLSFEQRVLAAVLAGGETAFASHETALRLWRLPVPATGRIEITTVLDRRPRVRGVHCHRSGLLIESDVTTVDGIPSSSPERSIVDVSSRLDSRILGHLVDDALRKRLTTLLRLQRAS